MKSENKVIDPAKMGICNRLAPGSLSTGPMVLSSGLLLQGEHRGDLKVTGPLVIFQGATLAGGAVEVDGDVYVFGNIGAPDDDVRPTVLQCTGILYLTATAIAYGKLHCAKPAIYEGAQVKAIIETAPMIQVAEGPAA